MANYYGNTRTNYFHVKDEAAFREFMGKVVGDEDGIDLWDDEKDDQGNTLFGFGLYAANCDAPRKMNGALTLDLDGKGCYERPHAWPVALLIDEQ